MNRFTPLATIAAAIAVALLAAPAPAAVTYTDANTGTNTTDAAGGPITLSASGDHFLQEGLWNLRSDGGMLGGSALFAFGTEATPVLRTRITGLAPNTVYADVLVYASAKDGFPSWDIEASRDNVTFTDYSAAQAWYVNAASGGVGVGRAAAVDGRAVFHLGDVKTDASGNLDVYIRNATSPNDGENRTIYDGVAVDTAHAGMTSRHYHYDMLTRIGPAATTFSGGPDGWHGDDLSNWLVGGQTGVIAQYFRNGNDGDNNINRTNDAGWSYDIGPDAVKLVMETGSRTTGATWELGLSDGDSGVDGLGSLFRFGTFGTTYQIRHWNGLGSITRTTGGTISGDFYADLRIEIDLLANGGDGSAVLFVNGVATVTVANLHLLDPNAPDLTALDTVTLRSNSQFNGPGDFFLTVFSVPAPAALPAGLTMLTLTAMRRRRR